MLARLPSPYGCEDPVISIPKYWYWGTMILTGLTRPWYLWSNIAPESNKEVLTLLANVCSGYPDTTMFLNVDVFFAILRPPNSTLSNPWQMGQESAVYSPCRVVRSRLAQAQLHQSQLSQFFNSNWNRIENLCRPCLVVRSCLVQAQSQLNFNLSIWIEWKFAEL